jgi:hypothetical protein
VAQYVAPRLTRYGTVAALTASDMKCTPGNDQFGYKTSWFARHDLSTTGEEWDQVDAQGALNGNTVGPLTFAQWVGSGRCTSLELGPHPVTGK